MSTTVHRPRAPRIGQQQSLYCDLAATICTSGLMERRHLWYAWRILATIAAFALVWVRVWALGNSWFQLLLAAALGLVVTQFGFLGHDGAHQQIFRSPARNEWAAG